MIDKGIMIRCHAIRYLHNTSSRFSSVFQLLDIFVCVWLKTNMS
ncbi:hypothetical protein ACA081_00380 [Candidatus Hodgkinia cicadicola]